MLLSEFITKSRVKIAKFVLGRHIGLVKGVQVIDNALVNYDYIKYIDVQNTILHGIGFKVDNGATMDASNTACYDAERSYTAARKSTLIANRVKPADEFKVQI